MYKTSTKVLFTTATAVLFKIYYFPPSQLNQTMNCFEFINNFKKQTIYPGKRV